MSEDLTHNRPELYEGMVNPVACIARASQFQHDGRHDDAYRELSGGLGSLARQFNRLVNKLDEAGLLDVDAKPAE